MPWSISIGRIAGTSVRIHLTFLLFLLLIGITVYRANGPDAAWDTVTFIVLIFACVVLHEFGHVLTARAFGIATRDITLFPIGGVASMERMPSKPYQELLVAIAGPLVNLLIFLSLFILRRDEFGIAEMTATDTMPHALAARVAWANLILMAFNLLPAFPMDGGRVLRALLALKLSRSKATKIAAVIGQGFAVLLGFAGFFGNPMLILIAAFIFIAAGAEAENTVLHDAARDLQVKDAMVDATDAFKTTDRIDAPVDRLMRTTDSIFLVEDAQTGAAGVVTREDLLVALGSLNDTALLQSVARMAVPALAENEPLESAIDLLETTHTPAVLVQTADGTLQGFVTRASLAEAILIRSVRPNWIFHRRSAPHPLPPSFTRDRPKASSSP
jgi:Zn-dependent protease/CBS domain-containing protein